MSGRVCAHTGRRQTPVQSPLAPEEWTGIILVLFASQAVFHRGRILKLK